MTTNSKRRVEDLKDDHRSKVKQLSTNFSKGQSEQIARFNDALVDQRDQSNKEIKEVKDQTLKNEANYNRKLSDKIREERINYEKKLAKKGPRAESLDGKATDFIQKKEINNLKRRLFNERESLSLESKNNAEVTKNRLDEMAASVKVKNFETERKFRALRVKN